MLAGRHFAIGVYLIALLFWVGPSSSSAEPKVFIGSVGSGPGVSFFGHGFVAIGDSTVPEQFWIAYDYTIHRRDGQTPTVQDLTDHPEALDFKIQKAPYFMHSWNYQMSENRTLTLVGLRLTVAQIAKFQGLLENDLRAPEKVLAYKAQKLNCITRILELLNQVVGAKLQVPVYFDLSVADLKAHISSLRSFVANSFLNEIPFNAIRLLQQHPLYSGETIVLPTRDRIFAEYLESIRKTNHQMALTCGWSPSLEKSALLTFDMISRDPSKVDFDVIVKRLATLCPQARAPLGQITLLLSRMVISDSQFSARQKLSQLGIELSEARP